MIKGSYTEFFIAALYIIMPRHKLAIANNIAIQYNSLHTQE